MPGLTAIASLTKSDHAKSDHATPHRAAPRPAVTVVPHLASPYHNRPATPHPPEPNPALSLPTQPNRAHLNRLVRPSLSHHLRPHAHPIVPRLNRQTRANPRRIVTCRLLPQLAPPGLAASQPPHLASPFSPFRTPPGPNSSDLIEARQTRPQPPCRILTKPPRLISSDPAMPSRGVPRHPKSSLDRLTSPVQTQPNRIRPVRVTTAFLITPLSSSRARPYPV